MKKLPIIYAADLETDPFAVGERPDAFAAGIYSDGEYRDFWGPKAASHLCDYMATLPAGIVYFHNGGKFDLYFMLERIVHNKKMLIIDGRITQCFMPAKDGKFHRVRDSYKILPFPLKAFDKGEIDYNHLKKEYRNEFMVEILDYQKRDCVSLYTLCIEYVKEFGPALTIGATAMKELKKLHDVGQELTKEEDSLIRKSYFVGGRVEKYKTGVFEGDFKVYDVNSMYPHVMSSFEHPIGNPTWNDNVVNPETYFVTAKGFSRGAFATRTKAHGISFAHGRGTYSVTIHEWNAAMELGLFDCEAIIETVNFMQATKFDTYIENFYVRRKAAKECGDKIHDIFYKFLLNNSYGRFALNPENFKESLITADDIDMRFEGYMPAHRLPELNLILWEKPAQDFKYANVATGASITGAARSVLMRGLHTALNPMYCDTDCIICEDLPGMRIDKSVLGAWDMEKQGNMLAIAGRKLYALYNMGECVKYACKGVRITPEQIVRVAQGDIVRYEREAPTYRLDGSVDWITRNVRRT